MAFSFFTKRTRLPSDRLKSLAGYLQLSGILAGTMTVLILIVKVFVKDGASKLPLPMPLILLYGVLGAASCYQIGRGLLQRQRWAGYLTLFTFGFPLVRKVIASGSEISIGMVFYPLLMLGLVGSVWPELGTVRDSELSDNDDDDSQTPKRNRGYGERRELHTSMPDPEPRHPDTAIKTQPDRAKHVKHSVNTRS